MNILLIVWLPFSSILWGTHRDDAPAQPARDWPSTASVLDLIQRVNNYQRTHPWTEKEDYNWIRGTYYTGVMAAFEVTGDRQYYRQCVEWGQKHGWRVPEVDAGRRASGANVLTCAQTWMQCHFSTQKQYMIGPVIAYLESDHHKNPRSQPLTWYWESGRRYVDALYTGPPALAMLYHATGDKKYLEWMEAFVWDVYGALYDEEDSLFYRDKRMINGYPGRIRPGDLKPDSISRSAMRRSFVYQESTQGRKVFWSRGNGWAFAGLARVLRYLPADHASYHRYLSVYRQMAHTLRSRQGPDGFWRMNLDDPDDFKQPETSGTGFFVYGLAMGLNEGWISDEAFASTVLRGWKALAGAVDAKGRVKWGQPVGYGPYSIVESDSHEYVSGIFLLAASELYKMITK